MKSKISAFVALALGLSCPRLLSAQSVRNFDDSRIILPPVTLGQNKETRPQSSQINLEESPPSETPKDFAYWSKRLGDDPSALPRALEAFDKEWDNLRTEKAKSNKDITFAASALRTLAMHSVRLAKESPDEAKQLLTAVNERLKPLETEFLPGVPYKTVYLNFEALPGMTYAATQAVYWANHIYNERQSALHSFFVGLKFIKHRNPALKDLDEIGESHR